MPVLDRASEGPCRMNEDNINPPRSPLVVETNAFLISLSSSLVAQSFPPVRDHPMVTLAATLLATTVLSVVWRRKFTNFRLSTRIVVALMAVTLLSALPTLGKQLRALDPLEAHRYRIDANSRQNDPYLVGEGCSVDDPQFGRRMFDDGKLSLLEGINDYDRIRTVVFWVSDGLKLVQVREGTCQVNHPIFFPFGVDTEEPSMQYGHYNSSRSDTAAFTAPQIPDYSRKQASWNWFGLRRSKTILHCGHEVKAGPVGFWRASYAKVSEDEDNILTLDFRGIANPPQSAEIVIVLDKQRADALIQVESLRQVARPAWFRRDPWMHRWQFEEIRVLRPVSIDPFVVAAAAVSPRGMPLEETVAFQVEIPLDCDERENNLLALRIRLREPAADL